MKRRKQSGPPIEHTLASGHLRTKHRTSDDIVAVLTERAGRTEISAKVLAAREQRQAEKPKSRQPPPSEEMKTVTEIGGLRWKLGRTK